MGEVGGGEGEGGGDGAGVHVAADLELVGALGEGGVHALLLLAGRDFRKDHLLAKDVFDLVLDELEFVERVGVDGDVEAEAEELLCPKLELVAEFFGVGNGGFELGVADFAFFGVDGHVGFELGDFFAQVFHDDCSVDGIDVHGDVDDFVDVDDGAEPAGVEGAGVAVDVHGAAVFGAEAEVGAVDFDGARADEVAEGGDAGFEGLLDLGVLLELGLGGDLGGGEGFFSSHFVLPPVRPF